MSNILEHDLVSKHEILSKPDAKKLLEDLGIETSKLLPKIYSSDPVSKEINAKAGDVLKIIRKSITAGESTYYRVVVGK
ncbi:MAG: DNA-directed RNA polymerase subunit H [Candidatus Aenigmatarchaeota archaeon]